MLLANTLVLVFPVGFVVWSGARASVKLTALGEDYAETEIPLNVRHVSSPVSSMVAGLAVRPRESSLSLPDTCVVVSHAVYTAGNLRPFESREFLFSQCVEGLFC